MLKERQVWISVTKTLELIRNSLRERAFPDKLLNCMGKEVFYEGA
jgi:hypothetical protein